MRTRDSRAQYAGREFVQSNYSPALSMFFQRIDSFVCSGVRQEGYGGWLHYTAAAARDVELARCLLMRKPLLVLGEGEYGVSDMLYAATRSKNVEIFREILGLAHDIKCLECDQEDDAVVYESSPSFEMMSRAVHAAARGGNVEILRELFKNCHDVAWYRDSQGSTALHSAASKGQLDVRSQDIKFNISSSLK